MITQDESLIRDVILFVVAVIAEPSFAKLSNLALIHVGTRYCCDLYFDGLPPSGRAWRPASCDARQPTEPIACRLI